MEKTRHALSVEGNAIVPQGHVPIVSGSVGADEVELALGEEWEGLTLSLVFAGSGETVRTSWDGASVVTVPWEVVQRPGRMRVGLIGRDGEDRRLTALMEVGIQVVQCCDEDGGEPSSPTVSEYQQALHDCREATDAATALVERGEQVMEQVDQLVTDADLEGYVTREDLAPYAQDADLEGYVTFEELGQYVTKEDLTSLITDEEGLEIIDDIFGVVRP